MKTALTKRSLERCLLCLAVFLMVSCGFSGRRPLVQATSPDGQWSVAVTGNRLWNGAIEVTATTTASGTAPHSHGVIDLCEDWDEAREKYADIQFAGEEARAGERSFRRPASD